MNIKEMAVGSRLYAYRGDECVARIHRDEKGYFAYDLEVGGVSDYAISLADMLDFIKDEFKIPADKFRGKLITQHTTETEIAPRAM